MAWKTPNVIIRNSTLKNVVNIYLVDVENTVTARIVDRAPCKMGVPAVPSASRALLPRSSDELVTK